MARVSGLRVFRVLNAFLNSLDIRFRAQRSVRSDFGLQVDEFRAEGWGETWCPVIISQQMIAKLYTSTCCHLRA